MVSIVDMQHMLQTDKRMSFLKIIIHDLDIEFQRLLQSKCNRLICADGKYAGNVPEDTSRYGSWNTVGVDCSGLLTVCWGLPKKIAARDIPNIAKVIDISEIRQGDVLAIRSHVMIFKEFIDEEKSRVRIIDSTRSTGKVSQREFLVSDLLEQGYIAYRKRQ